MKVLVVDDTVVYRKMVSDALATLPGVEVVGSAANGKIALALILELKPDLVTLDIEMPEMNGIEVLEAIRDREISVGIIVLSALTLKGGKLTIKALELGAFDFITKPAKANMEESLKVLKESLAPLIRAYAQRKEVRTILSGKAVPAAPPPPLATPERPGVETVASRMQAIARASKPELVAIGISTGGPNALAEMLPKLPAKLGVPILIVQHMPVLFTQSLAESLNNKCPFTVKEAKDNEFIIPNTVYIAPGGSQMKLLKSPGGDKLINITDDPPENHCKPSVDYLFRSLAHNFPGKSLGVIMTGMGNDGVMGLRLMKRHGGIVIAQDETTCTVFGMPKEAITAGVVDIVSPIHELAGVITKAVRGYPA
jgi:two-component system chemotaxis response regulator CheB